MNSGKLERCHWDVWEGCCWHTKTGHGSQRQGRRAPISSHYLNNTICRREWTLQPVDIRDTERNLSLFLSLVLHLLRHFLHFWTGWTQTIAYVVSQFTVLLPVSYPPSHFSDWYVVPLWRGVDRIHPTIKSDFTVQGEGIFLGVIPEEADKHKKANQPKLITKLTSNQTKKQKKHLLQFQRWTATGASWSFSGSWCHSIFDAFVFPFCSYFFSFVLLKLFLLWRASQARLCGSR